MNQVKNEESPVYGSKGNPPFSNESVKDTEELIIKKALLLLESKIYNQELLNSPKITSNYLNLLLASEVQEVFGIIILNQQHYVIDTKLIFKGTVNSCNVYTRDIIRETLLLNGAAIICFHNHPSGRLEPSQSDIDITNSIKKACDLMHIRLLDHMIVGAGDHYSFSENRML